MNNKLKNALGITGLVAIVLTIGMEVMGIGTYVSTFYSIRKSSKENKED